MKTKQKIIEMSIYQLGCFFLVFITIFLTACEKDAEMLNLNQVQTLNNSQVLSNTEIMSDLPEVVNGRLVFNDNYSFSQIVNWIANNQENHEEIRNFISFPGFISLKTIYDQGMNILTIDNTDTDDILISKVKKFEAFVNKYPQVFYPIESDGAIDYLIQTSNVMSYIVNADGVYQIGDTIYRASYNREYKIVDGDETKISQIINDSGTLNSSNAIIVTEFKKQADKTVRTEYFISGLPNSDKQRIRIRFESYLSSNRWKYDLRVTGQKRLFGIWWNDLGRLCTCEMDQQLSTWRIASSYYNWEDANVWKFIHGWSSDVTKTIIITPSSTRISYLSSYMPYLVSCKLTQSGSYYNWSKSNVFANDEGWNN